MKMQRGVLYCVFLISSLATCALGYWTFPPVVKSFVAKANYSASGNVQYSGTFYYSRSVAGRVPVSSSRFTIPIGDQYWQYNHTTMVEYDSFSNTCFVESYTIKCEPWNSIGNSPNQELTKWTKKCALRNVINYNFVAMLTPSNTLVNYTIGRPGMSLSFYPSKGPATPAQLKPCTPK